ncbi:MAG: NAD(P)-binding protein, partial [Rhodoferax sp.]|nr:NAD(P)-binding protein [Rhodoferax sp.]
MNLVSNDVRSAVEPGASVAIIGAGLAGAACARGLLAAGVQVTVFDKSRGVGGRLATRRTLVNLPGQAAPVEVGFDHGAPQIVARSPRLRAVAARAEQAGVLLPWAPRVHAPWPGPSHGPGHIAVPGMPGFVRHVLGETPLQLGQAVQRLQRGRDGRWQVIVDGRVAGVYDQVVLAMPPAQAAALLAGHHEDWSDALAGWPMCPVWTLMAVTDEVDWPWDAAEPSTGALTWITRNDRRPGRTRLPGLAVWVAHAHAAWSQGHLDDDPADVAEALAEALTHAWSREERKGVRWHHRAVHRWRYAASGRPAMDARPCWWDAGRGLGVCGDYLAGG